MASRSPLLPGPRGPAFMPRLKKNTCTLLDLPTELILDIIKQIDDPRELRRLIFTCKRIYQIYMSYRAETMNAVILNFFELKDPRYALSLSTQIPFTTTNGALPEPIMLYTCRGQPRPITHIWPVRDHFNERSLLSSTVMANESEDAAYRRVWELYKWNYIYAKWVLKHQYPSR